MYFTSNPGGASAQLHQLAPAMIHLINDFRSYSGTLSIGGIGTLPQFPEPPFLTLASSLASAFLSFAYFLATSR